MNQLDFLEDIISQNNNALNNLGSLSKTLKSFATQQNQLSSLGLTAHTLLRDFQKKTQQINKIGLSSQLNFLQDFASVQQSYNLAGVLSLQNELKNLQKSFSLQDNFINTANLLSKQFRTSQYNFSNSFDSVAAILSNQSVKVPNTVVHEIETIVNNTSVKTARDIQLEEIQESVDKLLSYYEEDALKTYTIFDVIQTVFFYISILLTVYSIYQKSDEEILNNQELLLKKFQEYESKVDSLKIQNQNRIEKLEELYPEDYKKIKITTKTHKLKNGLSENSKVIKELRANSFIKVIESRENILKVSFFDFKNDKTIEGWITKEGIISIQEYPTR